LVSGISFTSSTVYTVSSAFLDLTLLSLDLDLALFSLDFDLERFELALDLELLELALDFELLADLSDLTDFLSSSSCAVSGFSSA
jgi:hypothetical protein